MRYAIFVLFIFLSGKVDSQDIVEKYYAKGVEFQKKKVYSRAADYYSLALSKDPNHQDSRYNRAVVFFATKKFRKALFDIRKLQQVLPDDAELSSLAGICLAHTGQTNKAIQQINRSIAIDDQAIYRLRKADILLISNQPELAFSELDGIQVTPELEVSALELRALGYQQLNQPERAIQTYTQIIKLNPLPEFYYNRGQLNQQIGQLEAACHDFDVAAREPFFYDAMEALISCQWALKDFDAVAKTAKKGLNAHGDQSIFYFYSGLIAIYERKYDIAVSWFEKAEQLGLVSPELYINKGIAFASSEKKEQAGQAFQKALDLDPNNEVARHNMSLLEE